MRKFNEHTSSRVTSKASKLLRSKSSSATMKPVAASSFTQARNKKK